MGRRKAASSTPGVGHNSATGIGREQLQSVVDRIERLSEEKDRLSEDIREVFAEAKANGFDVKTLRAVVRIRKQDASKRQEQESLLDTYMHALGMLSDTPLGEAAIRHEFGGRQVGDDDPAPIGDGAPA